MTKALKIESIILGGVLLNGEFIASIVIRIPLKTMNRHGLIVGAVGNEKTKNIQVLPEQLYSFRITVLMIYIKGDFIGIPQ